MTGSFNRFAAIAAGIKPAVRTLVEETAVIVRDGAKDRSRYDDSPGRELEDRPHMRDAWSYDMTSDESAEVVNPVDYAIYNETGTTKMTAQPMLEPALEEDGRPYLEDGLSHLLEP